MSYDFEGEPTYQRSRGPRARITGWYWSFVLWALLDSGNRILERWAERRLWKDGGS